MTLTSLKNKKITVIGAGKSGIEAAKFAFLQGANVTLNDIKHKNLKLPAGLKTLYGKHPEDLLLNSDIIILSPGVPPFPLLKKARKQNIEVIGEIEFALQFLQSQVCAITGTNGKSTTVALLGEIMQNTLNPTFVGGNLGTPLTLALSQDPPPFYVALELSSFQLETVSSLHPKVAVLLNLSEDHLDRYRSFEHYCRTKLHIFNGLSTDDYALVNADDAVISRFLSEIPHKTVTFSIFGNPKSPFRLENDHLVFSDFNLKIPTKEINLIGKHMEANVLAASATALLAGIKPIHIINAIRKFKGLPHRMEFAGEKNKVRFYNDSKATNVGSVAGSMAGFDGNFILIMGGRHKGASYKPLKNILKNKCKTIITIGESASLINEDLGDFFEIINANTMEEAVWQAYKQASYEDSVVLSPACSSYDMFENYKERGYAFVNAVKNL